MLIYNTHIHIFNLECIPNKFIKHGFMRAMSNNRVSLLFVRGLDGVFGSDADFLSRQANFLKYNIEDWQENIFYKVKDIYPEGTKFVVLTLDMDYMGAGIAPRDFIAQVTEIVNLKRIHANTMLPFISIDPRRGTANDNETFVKKYIENHGFSGIKLYPPLGFFPFDERLDKVYAYAEKNNVPIITHCSKDGGIYYKGEVEVGWLNPGHGFSFKNEKMNVFRNNFMQPLNYEPVLKKYPDLKLCLAHFGGSEEVIKNDKDSWAGQIKALMSMYKNVYTDISFTLYNEKAFPFMDADIKNEIYGNRILFGTDFYMTERQKREKVLKDTFRFYIGEPAFEKIAYTNSKIFLTSVFGSFM
jgi:predicted TIM-barrel fold metal-dependent hydrolase